MKQNRSGASALKVSEICLGTMTWGEQNSEGRGASRRSTGRSAHGINFIDTAEMYPVPPNAEDAGRAPRSILGTLARAEQRAATSSCIATQDRRPGPARVDPQRRAPTSRKTTIAVGDRRQPRAPADRLHRPLPDPLAASATCRRSARWQYDPSEGARGDRRSSSRSRAWPRRSRPGRSAPTACRTRPPGACASSRASRSENGLPPPASVQNGYSLVNRMFDGDPGGGEPALPACRCSPIRRWRWGC